MHVVRGDTVAAAAFGNKPTTHGAVDGRVRLVDRAAAGDAEVACSGQAESVAAPKRDHTAIRLNPEALAQVKALADEETEGNVSAMLRKLLNDALRAREGRRKP